MTASSSKEPLLCEEAHLYELGHTSIPITLPKGIEMSLAHQTHIPFLAQVPDSRKSRRYLLAHINARNCLNTSQEMDMNSVPKSNI